MVKLGSMAAVLLTLAIVHLKSASVRPLSVALARRCKMYYKAKHRKSCESCPTHVTWKVKFKCQICLSCLSSLTCLSCLYRVLTILSVLHVPCVLVILSVLIVPCAWLSSWPWWPCPLPLKLMKTPKLWDKDPIRTHFFVNEGPHKDPQQPE